MVVSSLAVLAGACAGVRPAAQPVVASASSVAVPAPVTTEVIAEPAGTGADADPAGSSVVADPAGTSVVADPAGTSVVADSAGTETVVLAGGCFWGVQGVFEHVKGVTRAESGYAGGSRGTADYESVSTGTTGHAEAVRITFDPNEVTYGQILQVFFSVVHDPTELDRQGPDTGSQYRSEIFAQNVAQQLIAKAYVARLTDESTFPDPIVTRVEINTDFFPAEAYHQDYLNAHPTYPYIAANDLPKVDALQRVFPQLYSDSPVLIFAP